MNFSLSDLQFGLRQLGVQPNQLTVRDGGITLTFTNDIDVCRFWANLARYNDSRVDVDTLLETVAIDTDHDGNTVLEFDDVSVDGHIAPATVAQESGASANGDDRLASLESKVDQLVALATQHLGARF